MRSDLDRRPRRAPGMLLAGLLALATGCSGELSDPQGALDAAKDRLDRTDTVRFRAQGDNLPENGVVLLSGQGKAKRPSSFQGRFRVTTSGLSSTVPVVSLDGELHARLPLAEDFAQVEPSELGIPDPARLLDPDQGMSTLLEDAREVEAIGQVREDEDVLDEVEATLPASSVAQFLPVANDEGSIAATFQLIPDSHELRSVGLTGPFYEGEERSRYTITLDEYDEPVRIELP